MLYLPPKLQRFDRCVRTPLNCILGLSSLLLQDEDEVLSPKVEESIRLISTTGDLLLTVVNDVLDYSKLESGEVDVVVERCNFQDVLNSVVRSLQVRADEKRIRIVVDTGMAVPQFVQTDSRRMLQVLFNLLGNAVKFSPEGSSIELGVSIFEKTETATRSSGSTSRYLRIVVKDSGNGIPKVRVMRPYRGRTP